MSNRVRKSDEHRCTNEDCNHAWHNRTLYNLRIRCRDTWCEHGSLALRWLAQRWPCGVAKSSHSVPLLPTCMQPAWIQDLYVSSLQIKQCRWLRLPLCAVQQVHSGSKRFELPSETASRRQQSMQTSLRHYHPGRALNKSIKLYLLLLRLTLSRAPHACHNITVHASVVTKRRNSWACRGNPNPEQETIKGTKCQAPQQLMYLGKHPRQAGCMPRSAFSTTSHITSWHAETLHWSTYYQPITCKTAHDLAQRVFCHSHSLRTRTQHGTLPIKSATCPGPHPNTIQSSKLGAAHTHSCFY